MRRIAALAILANQAAHAMAMCATEDSTAYAAGASAGVACQFPFSYLGVSYTECIFDSTADSATPWCAVAGWGSPSASVTWGFCNASCPVRSTTTTAVSGLDEGSASSSNSSSSSMSDTAIIALCVGVVCLLVACVAVYKMCCGRPTVVPPSEKDEKIVQSRLNGPHATYDYAQRPSEGSKNTNGLRPGIYDNIVDGEILEAARPDSPNSPPERRARAPADILDQLNRNLLPAMPGNVQIETETRAAAEIAAYRRVNEQARGPLAGQKTAVNSDAKYIATEIQAQSMAHSVKRVNEQVRGELAGTRTGVSADSKYIAVELAAQKEVATYRRVNEQARGADAGKQTAVDNQSKFIVEAKKQNRMTSQVRRVNEQMRGEFAGKQTAVDANAIDIARGRQSQALAFDVLREKRGMTGATIDRNATTADARHGSVKVKKAEIPEVMGARESVPPSMIEKFVAMMGGGEGAQTQPSSKMDRKRSSLV